MTKNIDKVLVVDDVEEHRSLLDRQLSKAGFNVDVSANGEEALQKLKEANYDLVLLDISMPDKDGITVLNEMRQHDSLSQVFVIMITAEDDMKIALRCLRSGAQGYVTKPFDLDQIKQQIAACEQSAA